MGAPVKQEPAQRTAALEIAIVARGRTVRDLDGVPHAAGDKVQLPASEIARLRARGFLIDPERPAIPLADGPTFGSATGPRIKRG
ncbi:hypothetical protein [Paraburkholderia sp. 2C]